MLCGRPSRTFITLILTVAVAAATLAVGSARAAVGGSANCQPSALTEPFAPFGDPTLYELVPGGDFPGTLGAWSVRGGSTLAPWGSDQVLSIPASAAATSPPACVNVAHPTVRFYARSDTPGTTVVVAAVLDSPAGAVAIPIGAVKPTRAMAPTQPLAVRTPLLGTLAGEGVLVGLRFESRDGAAQIDDVYIDPWRSG